MRTRLLVRLVRVLILLEGVTGGLWIARLLSTLTARGAGVVLLIGLRGLVSVVQMVSFMLLVKDSVEGRRLGIWSLVCSAILMVPEIGWRLAPTNTDPTFRWGLVGAYWVYAAAAVIVLKTSPAS
jgi:hypothetical protein